MNRDINLFSVQNRNSGLSVSFSYHINSPVFLQLQDGSAEFLLQVAALLHGQRVRLFGEGLSDLGQVAVVVDLVSERERERECVSESRYFIRGKSFYPNIGLLWLRYSTGQALPLTVTVLVHMCYCSRSVTVSDDI